jgi:hypothetical protein
VKLDFSEGVELDLSFLGPGMYLVWVGERGLRVLK